MIEQKTSVLTSSLLWFGAAVSIAEILTGSLFAPLGFAKGVAAIILGHVIGCTLLYLAGIIGANTEKSAMETVKMSFGKKGGLLFAFLNIAQLIGWSAVMIYSGADFAFAIFSKIPHAFWAIAIGSLTILWVFIGQKNFSKINFAAMAGLFALSVVLSALSFKGEYNTVATNDLSFFAAMELSVAMPVSWLPLISDYTRNAKKKRLATFASAFTYFLTSCWMYIIGLAAALYTNEADIAAIMLKAGLPVFGILIIIFSTVTTTFLDIFSAGVSANSISSIFNEKATSIAICIIGVLLAVFTPVLKFESFLYFISSVFAPMIAILISDYFFLKSDNSDKSVSAVNIICWLLGFIMYRIFLTIETPLGVSVPVMIFTAALSYLVNKFWRDKNAL